MLITARLSETVSHLFLHNGPLAAFFFYLFQINSDTGQQCRVCVRARAHACSGRCPRVAVVSLG